MPFGLKNARAMFQCMMNTTLRGLVGNNCFVYLDDIIIFGSTIQKHKRNLAIVLNRLQNLELKIIVRRVKRSARRLSSSDRQGPSIVRETFNKPKAPP